jgi:hypothetical protein
VFLRVVHPRPVLCLNQTMGSKRALLKVFPHQSMTSQFLEGITQAILC